MTNIRYDLPVVIQESSLSDQLTQELQNHDPQETEFLLELLLCFSGPSTSLLGFPWICADKPKVALYRFINRYLPRYSKPSPRFPHKLVNSKDAQSTYILRDKWSDCLRSRKWNFWKPGLPHLSHWEGKKDIPRKMKRLAYYIISLLFLFCFLIQN